MRKASIKVSRVMREHFKKGPLRVCELMKGRRYEGTGPSHQDDKKLLSNRSPTIFIALTNAKRTADADDIHIHSFFRRILSVIYVCTVNLHPIDVGPERVS